MTREDINPIARLQAEKEQLVIDLMEQAERAMLAEAEVDRLRAQLRIAVDGLGTIADRGGEDWVTADRALTRMAEVE
jgi:uncharacterized protein YnzC (UPF0291/DUF896 family)